MSEEARAANAQVHRAYAERARGDVLRVGFESTLRAAISEFLGAIAESGLRPNLMETRRQGLLGQRRQYWRVRVPTSVYSSDGGWNRVTLGVLPDGSYLREESWALPQTRTAPKLSLHEWRPDFAFTSAPRIAPPELVRQAFVDALAELLRR